ncbi:carboxypeptidase regulatory-like domain-containing protein [Acinetobacter sp. YH12200]|uniref:carboxypeptidase regulatory-like domain-containing protein n=1 Tax=Acinetobacter sp. YH12200 TaxID=2601139 RepID=UPI00211DBC49|nr:carboxypeptidase regulatory-like domain-containing protein [Acinetobacter sp. YH12200]
MNNFKPILALTGSTATRSSGVGLEIRGTIKEVGGGIPCRVRLFEKLSGLLVADIATDSAGNYRFSQLMKIRFFIVAHHPATQFNAVIQDNVVPK